MRLDVRRMEPGGIAFQAEETVCAKVLGQKRPWHIRGTQEAGGGRGRVDWREAET